MPLAPTAPCTMPYTPMPFTPIQPLKPLASTMPFDPAVLLTLKFRGRSVVVPRDRCADYDGIIAVAQRSLRFLRPFAQEDLVLMAVIPDHPNEKEVEVSKEAWPLVKVAVESVTIALESELRSSGDWECDSGSTVTSGTSTRRSASPLRNPLFMKR